MNSIFPLAGKDSIALSTCKDSPQRLKRLRVLRSLKKNVLPGLLFCSGLALVVGLTHPASADLASEISNMKKVAVALQDVCAGATEATMVVLGIHYSGKFIKYALG